MEHNLEILPAAPLHLPSLSLSCIWNWDFSLHLKEHRILGFRDSMCGSLPLEMPLNRIPLANHSLLIFQIVLHQYLHHLEVSPHKIHTCFNFFNLFLASPCGLWNLTFEPGPQEWKHRVQPRNLQRSAHIHLKRKNGNSANRNWPAIPEPSRWISLSCCDLVTKSGPTLLWPQGP